MTLSRQVADCSQPFGKNVKTIPLSDTEVAEIQAEAATMLAEVQTRKIAFLQSQASAAVRSQLWMTADPSFAPWTAKIQTAVQAAVTAVQAAKDVATAQAVTLTMPANPTPALTPTPVA